MLGDCNARAAFAEEDAVGALAGENEDLAGHLLVDLCNSIGCSLVNTFPSAAFPTKTQTTWKDRCIDYAAVPRHLLPGSSVQEARTDLLNLHDDHEALCVEVKFPGRVSRFSRSKQGCRTWRIAQWPGWGCDVHTHAEHIFEAARSSRVRQQKTAADKPFVSASTWQLILEKKECLRGRRHKACGNSGRLPSEHVSVLGVLGHSRCVVLSLGDCDSLPLLLSFGASQGKPRACLSKTVGTTLRVL